MQLATLTASRRVMVLPYPYQDGIELSYFVWERDRETESI